jgi:hypothetical protein
MPVASLCRLFLVDTDLVRRKIGRKTAYAIDTRGSRIANMVTLREIGKARLLATTCS